MYLIIIGVLLIISHSNQTHVNKCKNTSALPKVIVSANGVECIQPPCPLLTGHVANIIIEFASPGYSDFLVPNITAITSGITLPWFSTQKNACEGILNTVCPVVKDEPIVYKYEIEISSFFPEVYATLVFSLTNEVDKMLFTCFAVDVHVVHHL